jgi:hypothetical protein
VHLMQGMFFCCACYIHAHNSDLLPVEKDPNVRVEGAPYLPFMYVTGLLSLLSWTSFFLCTSTPTVADAALLVDHVQQAEEVRAKERAIQKVQAQFRGKTVREEETMRKRRSSVGTADI